MRTSLHLPGSVGIYHLLQQYTWACTQIDLTSSFQTSGRPQYAEYWWSIFFPLMVDFPHKFKVHLMNYLDRVKWRCIPYHNQPYYTWYSISWMDFNSTIFVCIFIWTLDYLIHDLHVRRIILYLILSLAFVFFFFFYYSIISHTIWPVRWVIRPADFDQSKVGLYWMDGIDWWLVPSC